MPESNMARNHAPKSMQSPRLPELVRDNADRRTEGAGQSIKSGPRGQFKMSGPFAIYLHSPSFGELAQQLGGHLRFKTSVPPRLSEFAILVTASHWKAQYEWAMHAPMAEKQGVKPQTIRDLQAGRAPKSAPRDEMAIYAFVKELYAKRRVGNGELQPRVKAARRSRHRRTGRHARLLRHGVDDAQHVPGAAARRHQGAVQREEVARATWRRRQATACSSAPSRRHSGPSCPRPASSCCRRRRRARYGGADGRDRIIDLHGAGAVEFSVACNELPCSSGCLRLSSIM